MDDYGLFARVRQPKSVQVLSRSLLTQFLFQLIVSAPLLYAVCTACAKAALCLFYLRLDPSKLFQAAVWTTMIISVGAYTGIFFSVLFACQPIAASWDPALFSTGVCLNRGAIYIATAVIGVITDVVVILLPIPTIWGLHMHMKQKLGLLGIFGIGSM
jgi:hypothetical protein